MASNEAHSPGYCRDQVDIGVDLIRTAMNAMFGHSSDDDVLSAASTIEQGLKFIAPGRALLDALNSAEVFRLHGGGDAPGQDR